MAISFPRFGRGNFSHFAHFICNFALPFYSMLKKNNLLGLLHESHHLSIELLDKTKLHFGPLLPLAHAIFPNLQINYVARFSTPPMFCFQKKRWLNDGEDVDDFLKRLVYSFSIKPSNYGVVIVQRGMDREKYPGGKAYCKSGSDRRTIGIGFDELVYKVKIKRPDTISVELEQLPFAEQVSLFLNADTLIAQHGAAFVHAHWMPPQSHLIELQCCNRHRCPNFVPSIASIRGHQLSVVDYPCVKVDERVVMSITNANKVVRLVNPHK